MGSELIVWCISSNRLNDYLYMNRYYPEYERIGYSVYKATDRLRELIDNYYIEYVCIPNKPY